MRAFRLGISVVVIALLAHSAPAQAQGRRGAPPPITTLSGDVLADWTDQKDLLVNIADAMPAEKYSFKSTPAQRDFGAQVMHILEANQMLLKTLGGKTPAPAINLKATSKADILTALRQSYDYGDKVLREFNDTQLVERVAPPPFMGPSASRIRLIYGMMQHANDIYGQMAVYLRLNGIVPPASRGV
jgi:uncharacterized damage-inducible protein DinB